MKFDKLIEERIDCDFILSEDEIGYDKENNVYDVYVSSNSYMCNNCIGKIRVILSKNNEVLCIAYPLFAVPKPYNIESIKSIIKNKDKYNKIYSTILQQLH